MKSRQSPVHWLKIWFWRMTDLCYEDRLCCEMVKSTRYAKIESLFDFSCCKRYHFDDSCGRERCRAWRLDLAFQVGKHKWREEKLQQPRQIEDITNWEAKERCLKIKMNDSVATGDSKSSTGSPSPLTLKMRSPCCFYVCFTYNYSEILWQTYAGDFNWA